MLQVNFFFWQQQTPRRKRLPLSWTGSNRKWSAKLILLEWCDFVTSGRPCIGPVELSSPIPVSPVSPVVNRKLFFPWKILQKSKKTISFWRRKKMPRLIIIGPCWSKQGLFFRFLLFGRGGEGRLLKRPGKWHATPISRSLVRTLSHWPLLSTSFPFHLLRKQQFASEIIFVKREEKKILLKSDASATDGHPIKRRIAFWETIWRKLSAYFRLTSSFKCVASGVHLPSDGKSFAAKKSIWRAH